MEQITKNNFLSGIELVEIIHFMLSYPKIILQRVVTELLKKEKEIANRLDFEGMA